MAIVRPQNGAYGTTRGTSLLLDGVSSPMGVHISDLYLSALSSNRTGGHLNWLLRDGHAALCLSG